MPPPSCAPIDDSDADLTVGSAQAAELFKVLSSPVRVSILRLLNEPRTVSQLVTALDLSQPLVSQHLRVLRSAHLVAVNRVGREAIYEVSDGHITHVIDDAITHALETKD